MNFLRLVLSFSILPIATVMAAMGDNIAPQAKATASSLLMPFILLKTWSMELSG